MAPVTRRRSKEAKDDGVEAIESSTVSSGAIAASTYASSPSSATGRNKRKSPSPSVEDEGDEVEAESSKRQKLAVRVRSEGSSPSPRKSQSRTRVEIEIPVVKTKMRGPQPDVIADSEGDGDELDEVADEIEDGNEVLPTPLAANKQLEEDAEHELSLHAEAGSSKVERPPPTPTPVAVAPGKKSKHIVFGDDEDVDKFVAAGAAAETAKSDQEAKGQNGQDGEEDSDDEAPEAVSTSAAARQQQQSELAMQQAAERQESTLKRKRQERDTLFKEQATKRKRDQPGPNTQDKTAPGEKAGRRRAGKYELPDVLPASFLTDSESDDEDAEAAALRLLKQKRPKKITFDSAVQALDKQGKRPADQVVGRSVYKVLAEKGDNRLAPKAGKNSRDLKQRLMQRRRIVAAPTTIRGGPAGRGFFKKR